MADPVSPRRAKSSAVLLALAVLFVMTLSIIPVAHSAGSTNVLLRHVTSKAVDRFSPVLVTSTFFTTDNAVYSWLNIQSTSSLVVRWDWYDPSGGLYSSFNSTVPSAGNWFYDGYISVGGNPAENKTGTWQLKIFFDGTLAATDTFQIIKPPWGLVGSATSGPGAAGIAIDPITNEVYTVGGSDSGQLCVTVGTQTACQYGGYLRAYDGKNLTQLLKSISVTLAGGVFVGNSCLWFSDLAWNQLRLIHNSANGPLDVVVENGLGCIWDYSYPSNASNLIYNPQQGWTDIEPTTCLPNKVNFCTYIDTGTSNPALQGSKNSLYYSAGSDICEIHVASCANNFGAAYSGGPFAFDSANGMIYAIGTNNQNVLVINAASFGLVATIAIPSGLAEGPSIAVNPVTNRIYVAGGVSLSNPNSYPLVVIDGSRNSIVAQIPNVPSLSYGGNPIAIDTQNNLLYMRDWVAGTISIIDGSSNSIIAQIPAGAPCNGGTIAVNPTLGYVYLYSNNALCQYASPVASGSSFHQVVINEVAFNPPPGTYGQNGTQWVELYNPGSAKINVGGWTLTPACSSDSSGQIIEGNILCTSGVSAYIPDGTTIPAHGYYVYETAAQSGYPPNAWLSLGNQSIVLRDASGRIIDWTPSLSDPNAALFNHPTSSQTWQRYPNGMDTGSLSDWRLMPATKGSQNLLATTSTIQVGQQNFPVAIASNSTVSTPSFNQAQKQLSFTVSGPSGTRGIATIGFSSGLLGGTLTVLLDGTAITPTINKNSTYTLITVTYPHSSHTITVTGETAAGVTTTTTITASSTSSSTQSQVVTTTVGSSTTSSSTSSAQQAGGAASVTGFCVPDPVGIGSQTTCFVFVGGQNPTGTVSLSSSSPTGSFPQSSQCTLASGSCTFVYTDTKPSAVTVTARYSGDSNNAGSSGTVALRVVPNTASVDVQCSPNPMGIGSQTKCTGTVTGSSPTGTLSFSTRSDRNATGSFPSTAECTLVSGACSVSYSDTQAGTARIYATYSGDSVNSESTGATDLSVGNTSASQGSSQSSPSLLDSLTSPFVLLVIAVGLVVGIVGGTYSRLKASRKTSRAPHTVPATPIELKCPNCGTAISSSEQFCSNCGKEVRRGDRRIVRP